MDEKFQYRRLPAVQKKIIDINPEKDVRVRIFGKIIDKADGTIIVDDGTSTATIVTDASCCAARRSGPRQNAPTAHLVPGRADAGRHEPSWISRKLA